jgi:2-C-methyl-D-erythritol 4-phosphate cytidylyltransferase/2-C-methyl-D-erythritol 2,4-cyclodiphosphate synthase
MAHSKTRIAVVLTAAGLSERFGGGKKELVRLGGRTVLDRALSPFLDLPGLEALVITAPPGREAELLSALSDASRSALDKLGSGHFSVIAGGATRRDSVRAGLEAAAAILSAPSVRGDGAAFPDWGGTQSVPHTVESSLDSTVVLVHDGARPWVTSDLVFSIAAGAAEKGACVPVVPLIDTPKELGPEGLIKRHPPRASLGGVQTPQGFRLCPLLEAHRRAAAEGVDCTDDAELWDRYIGPVAWIPGDQANRKITIRADLEETADAVGTDPVVGTADPMGTDQDEGKGDDRVKTRGQAPLKGAAAPIPPWGQIRNVRTASLEGSPGGALDSVIFRIGQGWDLHRLVPGRRLMIGGIEIPSELGEDAHSDGDVLLHAVIDAILGAAALGDIGTYFPPSDENWRGADSRDLARRTAALVRSSGWEIGNIDCTVVLERPRLGPHRGVICGSIADCLEVARCAVSFKAKTAEGMDAVGEGRAIEAMASVLLYRP